MMKKYRKRHYQHIAPWWCRIPRPIWVLLEVLVVIVVAHVTHISPDHLLPLFRLFTMR